MRRCVVVAWLLCAWVLWQHVEYKVATAKPDSPRLAPTWGMGEVSDTRAACEATMQSAVQEEVGSPGEYK